MADLTLILELRALVQEAKDTRTTVELLWEEFEKNIMRALENEGIFEIVIRVNKPVKGDKLPSREAILTFVAKLRAEHFVVMDRVDPTTNEQLLFVSWKPSDEFPTDSKSLIDQLRTRHRHLKSMDTMLSRWHLDFATGARIQAKRGLSRYEWKRPRIFDRSCRPETSLMAHEQFVGKLRRDGFKVEFQIGETEFYYQVDW